MENVKEKVTEAFAKHKSELISGMTGFLLGTLFVYGKIHNQISRFMGSVSNFLNE